jgi:hypothetical protein
MVRPLLVRQVQPKREQALVLEQQQLVRALVRALGLARVQVLGPGLGLELVLVLGQQRREQEP